MRVVDQHISTLWKDWGLTPINGCEAVVKKKGGNRFLRCFQQFRSYCDGIEIQNNQEISFSSQKVLRHLSVVQGPKKALHNAAYLYSDHAIPLVQW